jgi:hypothetical protein
MLGAHTGRIHHSNRRQRTSRHDGFAQLGSAAIRRERRVPAAGCVQLFPASIKANIGRTREEIKQMNWTRYFPKANFQVAEVNRVGKVDGIDHSIRSAVSNRTQEVRGEAAFALVGRFPEGLLHAQYD